jgi:hypothetical protein
MASGELGVGTEGEQRASLTGAGLVPMWPFMEKDLATCRDVFNGHWAELRTPEFPTVDELLAATIATARRSGRRYWMLLALNWLDEAERTAGFDPALLAPDPARPPGSQR